MPSQVKEKEVQSNILNIESSGLFDEDEATRPSENSFDKNEKPKTMSDYLAESTQAAAISTLKQAKKEEEVNEYNIETTTLEGVD